MGYVGNVVSDGETNLVASTLYGSCSTAAATAAKIVECANYDALIAGTTIHVKFIYSNTADEPTLNVNGTGALPIYVDGVNYPGKTALASWQPNSVVSLTYDGTAWRMNDVGMPATNTTMALLNMVYPIGAIYLSANSTNPATLFGGTWEQLKDRFLLAAGTSYAAGSTGGTATNTLAVGNLPSHSHTVGAHSHGLNSHVHSVGAHSHGLNGHTHSVGAHAHGLNNHTHTGPSHSHGLNNHTHSIPALSGSAASNGAHSHSLTNNVVADVGAAWQTGAQSDTYYTSLAATGVGTNSAGAHTHTVSTNASTTGGSTASTAAAGTGNTGGPSVGTTANSTAFNTGGNTGNTANSAAFNTGAASGSTANSSEFNTGATGSGTAVNNMPPYLTVYCWKRVA